MAVCLRNAGQLALEMGAYDAAKASYATSLQFYSAIGNQGEIALIQMGLARVALAQGEPFAEGLMAVLAYLGDHPYFENVPYPLTAYLQAYACLHALGDDRAGQMIDEAHTLLQKRAEQFTDPQRRQSFMALPEHQELLKLYADMGKKKFSTK